MDVRGVTRTPSAYDKHDWLKSRTKKNLLRGTSSTFNFFNLISLLVLLASILASAKPAWLNFGQHRGTTYFYNDSSKKKQNWWKRFTISIASNNHNTEGHGVIKTKDLSKK